MNNIIDMINHYGYLFIFIALALQIIALPIPGETLMTYCGYLAFQGKLNWFISILFAAAGTIAGVTITYYMGLIFENKVVKKYGSKFHFGEDKLLKATRWFEDYGNSVLAISYFLPGVKHIAGYAAGVLKISFKSFAISAYSGAFLWAGTFITLGKILGESWSGFHASFISFVIIGMIINVFTLICIYVFKNYKRIIQRE